MKLQIVLFILMTITLISCKKEPIEPKEKISFFLFARQSDFVWVDNIRGEIIKADDVSAIYRSPLKTNSNVKYVEFILGISTCNVDIDEITKAGYDPVVIMVITNSDRFMMKPSNDHTNTLQQFNIFSLKEA